MVSDSTVREAEREQPQPAEGQVWVPPLDVTPAWWLAQDGTVTVGAPLSDPTLVRLGPYRWLPVTALRRWRCIGVQTEHGRVMVGDEFALPDGGPDVAVRGVLSHDQHVFVDGGRAHGASWLLAWGKRTRYAPARVGERFRDLDDGTVYTIPANQKAAPRLDAAKWERLNPAPSSPLDAPAALGDMQGTDLNPANSADWRRALAMGPRAEQGPSPLPLDASPPASATAAEAPGPAGLAPGAPDGARLPRIERDGWVAEARDGRPLAPPPSAMTEAPTSRGKSTGVDRYRRAIDQAIASDHGPFQAARAAALRALDEGRADPSLTPAGAMAELLRYEEARGGARTPRPEARARAVEALGEMVVAVYERGRSLP